ncbi:hypothetical protein [Haloferax sp. YSSS75]|uniref:hypothetical protein n=1 Tax=Haloferax sp. YSSS75 TaxID=3388564 RepID=UPI00398CC219
MFVTDVLDSVAFFLPELGFAVSDALFDFFELLFRRSVVLVVPVSRTIFPSTLVLIFPLSDFLFFVLDSFVELLPTLFVESTYLFGALRDVVICFLDKFLGRVVDSFFDSVESHVVGRKQRLGVDIDICPCRWLSEEQVPV